MSPHMFNVFAIPLHIMETQTTVIVDLSNTHQVVSLKLTNINYLYWRMQMKSYLLGQGVFNFIELEGFIVTTGGVDRSNLSKHS
jgi:hypothetical protein